MKNVFILSVSIIILVVCYNLKHAGLATGIAFYIAGCGTIMLGHKLFGRDDADTLYHYDEYDEVDYFQYSEFRNHSNDVIWHKFLEDMYDDDTSAFVSDDREKFYNDNISTYSNQLDRQIDRDEALGISLTDLHLNN